MWYQNICSASFSFVTMHACERQTDGQTDGQNYDSQDRPRICSRGKNGGLDQHGALAFKRHQFGTAGVEGVKDDNSVCICSVLLPPRCNKTWWWWRWWLAYCEPPAGEYGTSHPWRGFARSKERALSQLKNKIPLKKVIACIIFINFMSALITSIRNLAKKNWNFHVIVTQATL